MFEDVSFKVLVFVRCVCIFLCVVCVVCLDVFFVSSLGFNLVFLFKSLEIDM